MKEEEEESSEMEEKDEEVERSLRAMMDVDDGASVSFFLYFPFVLLSTYLILFPNLLSHTDRHSISNT